MSLSISPCQALILNLLKQCFLGRHAYCGGGGNAGGYRAIPEMSIVTVTSQDIPASAQIWGGNGTGGCCWRVVPVVCVGWAGSSGSDSGEGEIWPCFLSNGCGASVCCLEH